MHLISKACVLFSISAVKTKIHGGSQISKRIKYNKAILIYKALNNLTPEYITDLIKPRSHIHSVNLRSSKNGTLHVPKSRTTLYEGSNSLPHSVRIASSLNSYKTSLSVFFLNCAKLIILHRFLYQTLLLLVVFLTMKTVLCALHYIQYGRKLLRIAFFLICLSQLY